MFLDVIFDHSEGAEGWGRMLSPQRGRRDGKKGAGVARGIQQGVRESELSCAWLLLRADSVCLSL